MFIVCVCVYVLVYIQYLSVCNSEMLLYTSIILF
jgi:hypothetical protein